VYLTAIAAVAAALACTAYADDQMSSAKTSNDDMKPQKAEFTQIDVNKDGSITSLEASQKNHWLSKNFNTIDTNKDGRISKEEYDKALS
jgi:Ca2+-binding EF-hand superfamily protein